MISDSKNKNGKSSSSRVLCFITFVGAVLLLGSCILLSSILESTNPPVRGLTEAETATVQQPMIAALREEIKALKEAAASAEKAHKVEKNQPQNNNEAAGESVVEELYRTVTHKYLAALARSHREHYKNASPFPHIAIDNIFPDSILQKVIQEHPESLIGRNGCLKGKKCFSEARQNKKSAIETEEDMGMYTRILFSFLKSSIFTHFLEDISGIRDVIPDPHFRGSGLHFTSPGGNLNVHADFNQYAAYKIDRRINVFIYLNNDWPDKYGGHLELWSRDMKSCHERIAPKLGRFVVFSSTDFSYHGHPEPITAPVDRARRSMALYYYTNGRPENECLEGNCNSKHSTLFQTPVGCEKCLDDICKQENTLDPPTWMARK